MKLTDLFGKRIILFDGAMGTSLQAAGLGASELPEAWNIKRPEVLRGIHLNYLRAGSDVVTTNTFGALQNILDESAPGLKTEDVYRAAIDNARYAVEEFEREKPEAAKRFVAADLGPTGSLVEMPGGLRFGEVYELYKRAAVTAEQSGADLLIFETQSDTLELKAGLLAAKEHTRLPVFATMTFQESGRTLMGSDPETAVNQLQDLGIEMFGANCSLGPDALLDISKALVASSGLPILIQPNAGLPKLDPDGNVYYDISPEEFSDKVIEIIKCGVSAVGGCCGTNSEFIKVLREKIDKTVPELCPALTGEVKGLQKRETLPSICSANKCLFYDKDTDFTSFKSMSDADFYKAVSEGSFSKNTGKRLMILTASTAETLDKCLRMCRGKPAVSVKEAEPEQIDEIRGVCKKYGAVVIE